jgi:tetratricopeptide (TPR) repeat protein
MPRNRRLRRGFIFLLGSRTIFSNDASAAPVRTVCPRCNQEADFVGRKYRTWFTFFLIPIFPISGSKTFTQCSNCGGQFPVNPDDLRNRLSQSQQQQSKEAIGLYNSLRASPANSITLNQLMTLYASMKEFDQAIGAAGDFPQALQNSEQCMVTLGRVYLAKNDIPAAIGWFDAAIARNPHLGEGHYFKGVASLLKSPADTRQAVASARAARNAGYPDAEKLLRDAEKKDRGE